ncbi:serine hydrolase domain-containing protein [Agaribacterium haliotis]|uniref:serine hydrolase domain-containing protein n=1 Tax=Agaribacterium haliotis TaxID=2013869 RepID=UPI0013046C84|nr:serine hydrolase domain-containing protein [Agaribacterium haliotis]
MTKHGFAKFFLGGLLAVSVNSVLAKEDTSAYATPSEDFSVSALKHGYSLQDAKRLHEQWNLQKFLDITESGAYSYLHLPEFMPHAVIHRDGPVAELKYAYNNAIGRLSLKNKHKKHQLEQMISADDSPLQGLLVINKGKIVYELYPGMRKTDRHVWMSNSKTFAGLLIAKLEDEGRIDLQQPVSRYLKKAKGTAWENVKVFDVLNMQSGLNLEENPATRKGDTPYNAFVRAEVGVPGNDGKVHSHDEALLAIPKLHEPGQRFEYSSANTQMLGLIIEEITQKRLAEVISETIWMPSAMAADATLGLSPQGNAIIHGLISTRLDDMARFGMLYTPSAQLISREPIVTPSMLKRMQTSGKSDNYLKGALGPRLSEEFGEQPLFNSYQWDAVFADGDIYKSGMNGQGLYISPARDNVVVWFATGFTEVPMEAFARKISLSLGPVNTN